MAKDLVRRRICESIERRHAVEKPTSVTERHRLQNIRFENWRTDGWIDDHVVDVLCEILPPQILNEIQVVVGVGKLGPLLAQKISTRRTVMTVRYDHPLYYDVVKNKNCLIVDAARRSGGTLREGIAKVEAYGGHPRACAVLVDCDIPKLKEQTPFYSFMSVGMRSFVKDACPICVQRRASQRLQSNGINDGLRIQAEYTVKYRAMLDSIQRRKPD